MSETLNTVLLLALPASGKSEIRTYLAGVSGDQCRRDFHLGETIQIDDFPYVHLMRRIDEELAALGETRIFFHSPDKPFQDGRDWGVLIHLINEDYDDLIARRISSTGSAGLHLLDRIERAAALTGMMARFGSLSQKVRKKVGEEIEAEARELLESKHGSYPKTLEGRTIVIEFARGGPQSTSFPLPGCHGYAWSLARLLPTILERAAILYVWVTPEESRRKNKARTNPDDPGSILHHGVPIDVMLNDYGCDDMGWLEETSDKRGTVRVEAHGRSFHLPIARLDNRVDKTSFVRDPRKNWKPSDVKALHDGLREAFGRLHSLT